MSAQPYLSVVRSGPVTVGLAGHETGAASSSAAPTTPSPDIAVVARPRTHFDQLRARRTDAQSEALLAEALTRLHARRRSRRGSLVALPSRAPNLSAGTHLDPAG
jgi:hypothetical protein